MATTSPVTALFTATPPPGLTPEGTRSWRNLKNIEEVAALEGILLSTAFLPPKAGPLQSVDRYTSCSTLHEATWQSTKDSTYTFVRGVALSGAAVGAGFGGVLGGIKLKNSSLFAAGLVTWGLAWHNFMGRVPQYYRHQELLLNTLETRCPKEYAALSKKVFTIYFRTPVEHNALNYLEIGAAAYAIEHLFTQTSTAAAVTSSIAEESGGIMGFVSGTAATVMSLFMFRTGLESLLRPQYPGA